MSKKDQLLIKYFELFDEVTRLQETLTSQIKNGLFEIVQIRRNDKRNSNIVSYNDVPKNIEISPFLKLKSTKSGFEPLNLFKKKELIQQKSVEKETTLKQRKNKEREEKKVEIEEEIDEDYSKKKLIDLKDDSMLRLDRETEMKKKDPIYWFSLIPPEGLFKSQSFFQQSIETSAKIANLKIQMDEIEKEFKNLK